MKRETAHILGIAPYRFLPAVNGGHKAIEQLYRYLGERRKTIVVSTKNNNEKAAVHYTLIKLFQNSVIRYANLFYYFNIKRIIREKAITHLIIEHPYLGWLGILIKRSLPHLTLCIRSHNIESLRFKTLNKKWWKFLYQYEKKIHRQADISFFITDEDRQFAIEHFQLKKDACKLLTYGIGRSEKPSLTEREKAKNVICESHQIPSSHSVLLFNGDLSYAPNTKAVEAIVNHINPLLLQSDFQYTILICGRGLPDDVQQKIKAQKNILYTGFVSDIEPYFLAANLFINPVLSGGGIKTKLVEALGYNCSAVSTESGAVGVDQNLIKEKMKVVESGDWQAFADAIITIDITVQTPDIFYKHFYWGNIADSVIKTLEDR